MEKEEIGVLLLGTTSAWGIWSATNPSTYTILKFGDVPEDIPRIRTGMNVGLLSILATSAGIWMLYGKRGHIPAIATALTGVGLYVWYDKKLKEKSKEGGNNFHILSIGV